MQGRLAQSPWISHKAGEELSATCNGEGVGVGGAHTWSCLISSNHYCLLQLAGGLKLKSCTSPPSREPLAGSRPCLGPPMQVPFCMVKPQPFHSILSLQIRGLQTRKRVPTLSPETLACFLLSSWHMAKTIPLSEAKPVCFRQPHNFCQLFQERTPTVCHSGNEEFWFHLRWQISIPISRPMLRRVWPAEPEGQDTLAPTFDPSGPVSFHLLFWQESTQEAFKSNFPTL